MEKRMDLVSPNEKVNIKSQLHIPDDLFFSILSKLPIKSLKRFGCVRKSWSLLFDNSCFMSMYHNNFLAKDHFYYDDTSLLLHQTNTPWDSYLYDDTFELYYIFGKTRENMVQVDWPNVKLNSVFMNREYDSAGFNILGSGSVNGIFCLICVREHNIILWNPSTKEFKIIPENLFRFGPSWFVWNLHRGFGYDCVRNDYKVMCYGQVVEDTDGDGDGDGDGDVQPREDVSYKSYIWEIYSLKSNSWKIFDVNMKYRNMNFEQVYVCGLSHWLCESQTYNETYLLSFDWSNEVFLTTNVPSDIDGSFDEYQVRRHLVLLNGSIAFVSNHKDSATFHITILGELGIEKSWTKLFVLGPLPCLDHPIGAGKNSYMLFRKNDGGLVWLDLNTQIIEDLGIIANRLSCKIIVHKKNLLPLERIDI